MIVRFATSARVLLLCLAAASIVQVQAEERILSFQSDINVVADGSMTVAETITVEAEGQQIRRGIYRDFPTRYRDRFNNQVVVDFDVVGVARDGRPEPWRSERIANGVRVYIGDADVFLDPGVYSYRIDYRTSRQLGFFAEHDELYWNVTGNGWGFPIEVAGATVSLPTDVNATDITMEGYTGRSGEAGQDYTTSVANGLASIETTRRLAPREGLTLAMSWPKGVVEAPTVTQQAGYLLYDNLNLIFSLLGFAGIAAYLYTAWSRYGRDPDAGVVFPHYEPPDKYSPASARYVSRMGYDHRTLTAAVINLAVKGHLTITSEGKKDYVLELQSSDQPLAPGEQQLKDALFESGARLELDKENHKILAGAIKAHRNALRRDYLNIYFARNTGKLVPAILILFAMLAAIGIFAEFSILSVFFVAVSVVMIVVFGWLLRAPTVKGRKLMDKLEGFKLYMEVAEKDELNLRNPPELTPQLFERYLPFAIALGVEQAWSDRFAKVFAAMTAQQQAYHPVWYHGNFDSSNMGGFTKSVSTGFAASIASAATPPGSSSGTGGGGFSGGGGGGGGGGGW